MPSRAKMSKEHGQVKKILAANDVRQHAHSRGPGFLFLLGEEGGDVGIFLGVPNVLPSCSQCVLQHNLNSFSLYPISFALSSTLVTYISGQRRGDNKIIFWDPAKLCFFNFFVMGQSKVAITKAEKKLNFGGPQGKSQWFAR